MPVLTIIDQFKKLKYPEQLLVLHELRRATWGEKPPKEPATLFTNIRESRFNEGLVCPRCQAKDVYRYGRYKERQRYRCKICKRTYNDLTHSPLSGTWYLDRMLMFFEMLVEGRGKTRMECAQRLQISLTTAFYWRHKILSSLRANDFECLSGIVGADETTFLESEKGSSGITHRRPRKRGGKAKKRGLSAEQVTVVVGVDRKEQAVTMVAGKGQATAKQLDKLLGNLIDPDAEVCTDAAKNFAAFAQAKGLKHQPVNASAGERVRGIFHIQHANNFHMRLKQWMERFQGVATKYMNNYLYWFYVLEKHKRVEVFKQNERLLYGSNLTPIRVICQMFRPCLGGSGC
jgi:transposase-like protein